MTTVAEKQPLLTGWSVAVLGLGNMGLPMARHLAAAGAAVTVFNRTADKARALVAEGMGFAARPADAAAAADILLINVADTAAVEAVVSGDNGLLGALTPGKIVLDMGTTAVMATRALAAQVAATGAEWVDAPVSGGQVGAEAANLSIMVGGSADAVQRLQPLFAVLGDRLTHIGDVGAGQVAKAANQVIVGLTIGAVAEALVLAQRAGADPALVRDALIGGFADSRILDLHGGRMVDRAFDPGGRAAVQLKDMRQAEDLAAALGLDLPATRLSRNLYEQLVADGLGDLDHSGLIRAIDPDW